jgi:hypothetical protein
LLSQYSQPASRQRRGPLIVGPIMTMAEGMFWGVIGGAMFVFPPTVLALAVFQPRNTRTAALAMSALLFFPIVFIGFRNRWIDALLLALPILARRPCRAPSVLDDAADVSGMRLGAAQQSR